MEQQSKTRIAIVTTHPIQYYAPMFRLLAAEPAIELMVFYTWSQSKEGPKYDVDFDRTFEWDIPLLEGYEYEFVENVSKNPGPTHFGGMNNPALNEKIASWKPDTLLVFGWNFKSHLSCMRKFHGKVKIWFRGDSTLLDEKPGFRKIMRRIFLNWVYGHVDQALYVGENNKKYFLAHGLKVDQLKWVPHAIDNHRFSRDESKFELEAKNCRKQLGIADDDLVLIFAGKLEPKKDPEFMLRLAEIISSGNLKFIIIGNGRLENELKQKASHDSRIIFLDFQNQQKMPIVYRLGDIFVLPSKGPGESWGLAVNEAMACKRPVIASTKVGCTPDLIEQGQTGWSFEPGESGDLQIAALLQKILADRSVIRAAGGSACQKIQEYSYAVAIAKIGQLIREAG
ncbi:MAG: glycosyltransferase family 4 protein [Chitinophagales bacterium]